MEELSKALVLPCGKAGRDPCALSCKICSVFFDNSIVHIDFSLSNLASCESREWIEVTVSLHWSGPLTVSSIGFCFMLWSAHLSAILPWNHKGVSTEQELEQLPSEASYNTRAGNMRGAMGLGWSTLVRMHSPQRRSGKHVWHPENYLTSS